MECEVKFQRRNDWGTPAWLFEELHEEFDFTVDAAAGSGNTKVPRFWSLEDDGLKQDWSDERVWCNPPYGAQVAHWVEKAITDDGLAVLLVPVRSETAWWHRAIEHAAELRFIRGRVHFEPPPDMPQRSAPLSLRPSFASALLVFKPEHWRDFDNSQRKLVTSTTTPRLRPEPRQTSLGGE